MINTPQLIFDLSQQPALGRDDFMVAGSNRLAVQMVEDWQVWTGNKLALIGPEGAGKTHLAHVWAEISGAVFLNTYDLITGELPVEATAVVVEDVDRIKDMGPKQAVAEETLFHLHNALAARKVPLLVTGRNAPAQWPLMLPDLASRLSVANVVALEQPDDALLAAVLLKLFSDRQLNVGPDLISYLVPRIERSFADATLIANQLDTAALAQGRSVTRQLAVQVLKQRASQN